jgi:hypothetical protein
VGSIWHIGIAVPDLEKGTAATTPLLNRDLPAPDRTLRSDSHRPSLRDLFPSESEFAGEPILGSAL